MPPSELAKKEAGETDDEYKIRRARAYLDNRRYDELEIAEDIKAAFPQDADKDLATLKADYPSLFA